LGGGGKTAGRAGQGRAGQSRAVDRAGRGFSQKRGWEEGFGLASPVHFPELTLDRKSSTVGVTAGASGQSS